MTRTVFLIFFSLVTVTAHAQDVNGDGRVTVADAISILRIAVGIDPPPAQRHQVSILLPDDLYAVVGREISIYWDGIIQSPISTDLMDIDVVATKGTQQNRRWFFTPQAGEVGSTPWRLDVRVGGELVATARCTLHVAAPAVNTIVRRILTIGDSTTAYGQWLAEVVNLFEGGAGVTVTTVGTRTVTVPDSEGTIRTILHEAITGRTIDFFATDPESPFVFDDVFDFQRYIAVNPTVSIQSGD